MKPSYIFQDFNAPGVNANLDEIRVTAQRDLECLLEKCPKLKDFQDEIGRLLLNSGNYDNRIAVLQILFEASIRELEKHVNDLKDSLESLG